MRDVVRWRQWNVLVRCGRYERERQEMRDRWRELGKGEISLEGLLRMGDRAGVRVLLGYLRGTGLFDRI